MNPESESVESLDGVDRGSERRSFFLSAPIKSEKHEALHARIRNLSAGGMMIELASLPDPDLTLGMRITAELRGIGRVKGEIAWVDGVRYGVQFATQIDPELARKSVTGGTGTPDYVKPVLVPDRLLKNPTGLTGR